MKILSVFRRYALLACSLLVLLGLATPAFATHLRGGTVTWRVTGTTSGTYTVQFTLIESSRWSYPGPAGTCGTSSQQAGTCPAVNSSVDLTTITGGTFTFGDNTASVSATGIVTSINQAEDYMSATFVFSHTYNNSFQGVNAFFDAGNRISTLKIGHDQFEYINTIVSNYPNGSPTAATPAILAVPLQATATFNIATVVTDIDPNVNLTYRLATLAELYGPGTTSVPCPNAAVNYTSPAPPGFTVSPAGQVTWNTTLIAPAINGAGNCQFGVPAAGDLWPAQIMVEARNKVSGALITETPVDLMMKFVNPVGALPTITLDPSTTQTVAIGTPVAFTATANSTNSGAKVTLNASGIPSGATASGLNAAVTPPTTSNFNWTPGPGQDGTYAVTYTVTDNNLQQATATNTIVVATLPTISCAAPINVTSGQTGTLTSTVFDINQDPLNVVWSVDGTNVQTNSNVSAYPNPGTVQFQYTGSGGLHQVKVTATDPHGVAVSCTTSVTVYQRTVLAVASASGTAGGTVPLSATLTTSPDGVPVPNQMVTFSFAGTGAPSPVGAVTDATGVATVPVIFTTPGSFTATATFSNPTGYFTDPAGDIPPVADTATATITVSKATTSLSALTVPSTALVGSSLTVSTTLSRTSAPVGAAAGAFVVFTFTAPDSTATMQTATTDANGLASVSYTPTVNGVYSISAQFAGNSTLQAATSSSASVTVYQRTSLTLASASGFAGGTLTLSATLTTVPDGTSLAGQTVTFDFGGVISQATALTAANGVATVSVVFPAAGTFTATASFFNSSGFFADSTGNPIPDTASGTATIQAATTSLSALNPTSITFIGIPITVSTTLSRVSAPAGGVGTALIAFTFTAPGGAVTTANVTTDANGLALASYTPTTGGTYSIAASYAGSSALQPATTPVASVTVFQRTSLAISPVTATAGTQVSVSATLTNFPAGTPLAGQTVTFAFGGGAGNASATTDANGVATVVTTFQAAGTFSVTASFLNVAGFFANSNGSLTATTVAAQVTVALATTSLSSLTPPPNVLLGGPLTVSTVLSRVSAPSGVVSGASVAFTFTAPGGAVTTLNATTAPNGLASVNFTPTVTGVYSIAASFAGDSALQAATSSSASVSAYQRTSLSLASANGSAGGTLSFSATLTTVPGGTALTGQTVTFSFTGTGAPSPLTATTSASGVATVPVVFTAAGSFTATATFSNAGGFFTDAVGDLPAVPTTASAAVTVTLATTSLSGLTAPATAVVGGSLTVSTTLSRVSAPAGPVNGVPIVFTLTAPGGAVTTLTGTTTGTGLASVSFTPTTSGAYSIAASFAGTTALQAATSSSAAVTVYQRTSLALSSASGTAGSSVTLNATLTTVPGGVPLANQSVSFSFTGTGAPIPLTAVTDANGVATVQPVFTTAGSFTATAAFSNPSGFFTDSAGDIPPAATTASTTVTVTLATTSLSTLNEPTVGVVGNAVTLSTTLTRVSAPGGPVSGVPVSFVYSASGGAPVTLTTATTDANGIVSVNFTPTTPGTYAFSATFAGTNALATSAVVGPVMSVYQRTSVALASASGTAGSSVTLNATLTTVPGGLPLANQSVSFSFAGTGAPIPLMAVTDANGVATVQPVFTTAGSFTATAAFSNPAGFFTDSAGDIPPAATIASTNVTVVSAITSLSPLAAPPSALVGNAIAVSTILTRVSAPSGVVTGVPVVFTFTAPGGAVTTLNATTTGTGLASVNFTPTARGAYTIAASFAGTAALQAATSSNSTVTVYQRASLVLSPASGTAGSILNVSATLTTVPGGVPLANVAVIFAFGGSDTSQPGVTDLNGVATAGHEFTNAGSFTATATLSAPFDFFTDSAGSLPPAAVTASTTVTVTQIAQTINIQSPADVTYGSSITLAASGGASGNPVVWSIESGTGATLNGNLLTATSGVGSVLLVANQAGSTNYSAAPPAEWTVRLHLAPLTASIINTPHKPYDGTTSVTLTNANFQLGGLVGTDAFTVNTATGTFASAEVGVEQVFATIAATDLVPVGSALLANYILPASANGPGRIDAAGQTIMFTQPASPVAFGVAPIALTATGGASNNPVTFKIVNGPGSINGNALTINGAGAIIIAADQAGSGDYTAAQEVTQTVTVSPATPQLAFMPTGITYGTTLAANQINPSATGVAGAALAGSFSYSPALGTELQAGMDSVQVTFTPNDTTDYASTTGNVSIKVSADQPTLSLASTPISYGTGFAPSQITASATGPNGAVAGTYSYSVATGTILPKGTNIITVTFTPTDNNDYTSVSGNVSLLVNPATLIVTAKNQSQVYGQTANLTPQEGTTFSYSGFLNGESSSVLSGAPALSTTETATSLPTDANGHPVTYPITISQGSLSSSNYTFTFVGAQDTVLPTATSIPSGGTCAGVYQGGTYKGNLNVGPGQVCILISNTVNGNIQQTGGIVDVIQTTVNGNFQINVQKPNGSNLAPATSFQVTGGSNIQGNLQVQSLPTATTPNPVCGSTIKGDLQYQQNGAPVLIGSALTSDGCAGNNIGGNLQIQQNTATVSAYNNVVGNDLQAQNNTAAETITFNTVNGNLQVQNNTGSTTVNNNTVKGNLQDTDNSAATTVNSNTAGNNLQCQNDPVITGSGNTAKSKSGQCSTF